MILQCTYSIDKLLLQKCHLEMAKVSLDWHKAAVKTGNNVRFEEPGIRPIVVHSTKVRCNENVIY